MLPLLLVEEFKIQRSVGYATVFVDGAPLFAGSLFNANHTFRARQPYQTVKCVKSARAFHRYIRIYSRSFFFYYYYGENTLRFVVVDSSSSITASARLFINALRILNVSRELFR